MASKKLSAKELITDIRGGLSDAALMEKYALSRNQLDNLFTKLVTAGMLQQSESAGRVPSSGVPDQPPPVAPGGTRPGAKPSRVPVKPEHAVPQPVREPGELLAASAGTEAKSTSQWYDSVALVVLLLIIIPPLGLAGLLLNRKLERGAKAAVIGCWGFLVVVIVAGIVFLGTWDTLPWSGKQHQAKASWSEEESFDSTMKVGREDFVGEASKSAGESGDPSRTGAKEADSSKTYGAFQPRSVREARRKKEQLFKALELGSAERVRSAIEDGADVDARDTTGNTPLMHAAVKGYKDIAEVLLEKGANINARSKVTGWTALLLAARENHLEMVEFLLSKGANVHARNNSGETALKLASKSGYSEVVNVLYAYGAQGSQAEPPVARGGKKTATASTATGTELVEAAFKGDLEHVKYLLNAGVAPNVRTDTESTALMPACHQGHREIAELLIERGADVNARDSQGRTSLVYACQAGRTEMVRLLLKNGAEANVSERSKGITPLMASAVKGDEIAAQMLVDKGAWIDVVDTEGNTALLYACANNKLAVVRLLLSSGADVQLANVSGITPLAVATAKGHGRIVKLLAKEGARR